MSEIEKPLYPFRFLEDKQDHSWGQVCFKIADLGCVDSMLEEGWLGGNTLSEIMTTYLERLVGDNVFEYYGTQFPVLVKTIKTTAFQPLQMNVSDSNAEERYDAFGKTALWYIQEAPQDAELALGFKRDVTAGEFFEKCNDGTVKDLLNIVTPHKGEVYMIKPGTVFAAGPGLDILEISECSELTLCLAGIGGAKLEPEEDNLTQAFDMIDYKEYTSAPLLREEDTDKGHYTGKIAACDEFSVSRVDMSNLLHVFSDVPVGFTIYCCLSGEMSVQVPREGTDPVPEGRIPAPENLERYAVTSGHTMLIPSEVNDFYLVPVKENTEVLEIVVDNRKVRDLYTDEEVSPAVFEGEELPDPHVKNYN